MSKNKWSEPHRVSSATRVVSDVFLSEAKGSDFPWFSDVILQGSVFLGGGGGMFENHRV